MDDVEAAQFLFQKGLTEDDVEWLRKHFEKAGLPTPTVDIGWLRQKHELLRRYI